MQERGRDGGSAASEAERSFVGGTPVSSGTMASEGEFVTGRAVRCPHCGVQKGVWIDPGKYDGAGVCAHCGNWSDREPDILPQQGTPEPSSTERRDVCDVSRRADNALKRLTDRSVNSDRWMVGDEDCPPVLKLLDEFREGMLGMIPVSFDEQRVILDTKLLKVREIVRQLEEEGAERNDPLGCHPID